MAAAMLTFWDIFQLVGTAAVVVMMVFIVAWRRRGHRAFIQKAAEEEVCEHLRPALQLLKSRGHIVARAGQLHPELPFEIHIVPAFDPKALYDELKLAEPVFVSERNVLFCREDECELHPAK